MGFFALIGMNPTIQKMTASAFAEYWQHTDFFMAARMKIFGPIMLASIIDVILIKGRLANAFTIRGILMIGSFFFVLVSRLTQRHFTFQNHYAETV